MLVTNSPVSQPQNPLLSPPLQNQHPRQKTKAKNQIYLDRKCVISCCSTTDRKEQPDNNNTLHYHYRRLTMGVIYRYLASGLGPPTSAANDVDAASSIRNRTKRWKRQVYRLFPSSSTGSNNSGGRDRRKQKLQVEELAKTCIRSHDIVYNVRSKSGVFRL